VHVNALVTFPTGDPADMAAMTEADRRRLAAMGEWQQRSGAYLQLQGTRPQTIAHSLTDSPAGLLAWIAKPPTFSSAIYGNSSARSADPDSPPRP
jgi:hypothetical protein